MVRYDSRWVALDDVIKTTVKMAKLVAAIVNEAQSNEKTTSYN